MSQAFEFEGFSLPLVVLCDTGSLIEFKRLVKIDDQWALLLRMSELVTSGTLCFPRQVAKELAYGQHPDAPGAWIGSAKRDVRHPEPSEETLRDVLRVTPQIVDFEATADREVADPYIAAMAVEITARHRGCRVAVATSDVVDRLPHKLSLRTACERLRIEVWSSAEFVAWLSSGMPPDSS